MIISCEHNEGQTGICSVCNDAIVKTIDRSAIKALLRRAAESTSEYAAAIATQLYRHGSFYNNDKERAVNELSEELDRAADEL